MNRISIFSLILLVLLIASTVSAQEMRAFYAATFDINTQTKCDNIIADALATNVNAVFVEVRGRADAYYYPNREDSTYPNNEPRGELYAISPADLDVLQYFIDRLHSASPRVEVHAWCTTFNTWNRATAPVSGDHVYNAHPEWITENEAGTTYTYSNDAPLDPGIPAVQDHIYNVFMDIVRNYDVDGIHFDYIRLISSNSGYDSVAKAQFLAETGWNYDTDNGSGQLDAAYNAWRRDQIAQLVQRVNAQTALEKPWVEVSAFLVNFSGTDSITYLGQGYNWWVAHEAIDVLHPGCYASDVAGTVSDWNHYIGRLAENGNENDRPVVSAIGDYLLTDPNENATTVTTLRTNSRVPDGFNFFDYGSLYVDYSSPSHADNLFNTGGPMDTWEDLPAIPHKTDEETTPPNAPASVSATLVSGVPRISFSRPAAAGDGDLPVHYRVYRDTNSSVDLYYDNMVMEWWDLVSTRTSFSVDDIAAGASTYYYAAVAYDDWNNEASATSGSVTVTSGGEYIIESASGGLNNGDYSDSGLFTHSSSHSTASGCTSSIGSEFALPGDANGRNDQATFTPSGIPTGEYDVYVTCFNYSSANAQDITVRVYDDSGTSTSSFDLVYTTCGNTWYQVTTMDFTESQGHYIEFDNTTQSNIGDSTNSRMNAAAVKFVRSDVTPKESKPAVTDPGSSVTEVIIDSEPVELDYDDDGAWATSTYTDPYGGSTRYQLTGPINDYPMWGIDLPRAGKWAIDGYVRSAQGGLDTGVQYRFVDSEGTVHSVTATQQPGSVGWNINVDGVADGGAYSFDKGRVYITIFDCAQDGYVLADAIRMRYISTDVSEWNLY